jgi:outer membrane protein OmpA-like peptidoglycan-associated protein
MAANLIDTVKGLITPEIVDKAAASTGESPANASRALHGAVPTIFAALTNRCSTAEGASAVMGMIHTGAPPGIIEKLGGFLGGPKPSEGGQGLVGAIFGDRAESAGEALASSSGVKSSSVPKILELAAPLVAGVLGKEVVSRGVSAGGLSQLLSSQKTAVGEAPHAAPGLSESSGTRPTSEIEVRPTSELGAKPVSSTTARATTASRFRDIEERAVSRFRDVEQRAATRFRDVDQRAAVTAKRSPRKLIVPALAVLGMVIVGIIASTRSHAPREGVTAMQPSAPAMPTLRAPEVPAAPTLQAPAAPATPAPGGPSAGITLPDGKTLDVAAGSPEADFAHALGDPSVALPHSFRFDDLNFSSGSAAVGADADRTMDAVAAALSAYPSARVRVEGHSGKVGGPAANRALSASRARAVKEMLVARGVASDRIDTTRGGRMRMAPGKAEAGAKANRRAEIVILNR